MNYDTLSVGLCPTEIRIRSEQRHRRVGANPIIPTSTSATSERLGSCEASQLMIHNNARCSFACVMVASKIPAARPCMELQIPIRDFALPVTMHVRSGWHLEIHAKHYSHA